MNELCTRAALSYSSISFHNYWRNSNFNSIHHQVLPEHSTAASSIRSLLVRTYSVSLHCDRELSLPLQLTLYPLWASPWPYDPVNLTGSPQFISLHTTVASFIPQLKLNTGDQCSSWENSTLPEHWPVPLMSLMLAAKQTRVKSNQLVGVLSQNIWLKGNSTYFTHLTMFAGLGRVPLYMLNKSHKAFCGSRRSCV